MFQKKEQVTIDVNAEKIDTIIGKNSSFEGNIMSQGTVRIDGKFNGKIDVKGNIIIGDSAKLEAEIMAENVIVSGEIKGNINAKNQIEITSTGKIYGDIEVKKLIVDDGAVFDGKCTMIKTDTPELTTNKEKPKKES